MSDTLQHRIALEAEHAVTGITSLPPDQAKEYRAFCEGFPALLRTAGLLQSVTFLKAKAKHPHAALLANLTEQFHKLGLLRRDEEFLQRTLSLSTSDYITWTRIAYQVAYWHKRFAQALIIRAKEGG